MSHLITDFLELVDHVWEPEAQLGGPSLSPKTTMVPVLQSALCPRLIGRDEQLFVLEDALLAAHRGQTRFVAVGGEAGMGKTRLARELVVRARRLNWEVLWGACSEAELPLPYLPLVEALGNYLSREDAAQIGTELGAARRELAHLFPQLGTEEVAPIGDPTQAKLRLFEAVVALVGLAAREQGVLLVVEDVHWADAATRELLDHLARRLTKTRSLLLITYRSDELDRRHPLAPLLQTWRRSGALELVELSPLGRDQIAQMIAAIFGDEAVGPDFRDLMHTRTEGNPFVLEEMLKEAIDRSDVFATELGWERRSLQEFRIPETVRDTILLRFARLDPAHAEILQTAAALGRTFDYATLLGVGTAPEATVHEALAVGLAQQLLEESEPGRAAYRWRHALTQEAVVDEIVLPRRQGIHSRAADVLIDAGADTLSVARHLLGAGRFDESVPVCIAAAEEAEASLAFGEALDVLERAVPHVREPVMRSRVLSRMGQLLWMDGRTATAEEMLREGCSGLEAAGEQLEAASYRLLLARCHWEQSRPREAHDEFEKARRELELHGASADLSIAYMRLAGLAKFEMDSDRSLELAQRAVEVARAANADFERVWSLSWLAFSLLDAGRTAEGETMLDESFEEARRSGYLFIAHNIAYNDAFTRLHTMSSGVMERIDALASEPGPPVITEMVGIATSWGMRASGNLSGALDAIETARVTMPPSASEKVRWRTDVEHAEVLLELNRLDDATGVLPPTSERADLQDVVYDAAAQIRTRLARGALDEAVVLAREIADNAERLAPYPDTLAVASEALVAACLLEEAQATVDSGRAYGTDVGVAFLDGAEGQILVARGAYDGGRSLLSSAAEEAAARGFRLVEWRNRLQLAEALAALGHTDEAQVELTGIAVESEDGGALLIAEAARSLAHRLGLAVPQPSASAAAENVEEPDLVGGGERVVTSMFADVRGYTSLAGATAPAELADRIATFHRWAAAEVSRHHGLVDKFAGDAVMATFNAAGTRLDHATQGLEAALALSGKAALLDLGVGIGIAVGPAVVARTVDGGNVSVLGTTTNLAARLQTAANGGEIMLSDETHRRVEQWLAERGLVALPEALKLKGFDTPQSAWRIRTGGSS